MCGLAGFLSSGNLTPDEANRAYRMAAALSHRGPDDKGMWTDGAAGIALAHRRLSILELSPAGHQPMISVSGRFVIAFNGEIYNHLELRSTLGDVQWRGHSDTETLLASVEVWGIEATLKKTVGMFAIALWDRAERTLTLARDRMGEKPLYYGWQGETLFFGSELKALKAHPAFQAEIDRDALTLLLRYSYIPVPHSIYRGIHKLPPGMLLQISFSKGISVAQMTRPASYWMLSDVVSSGQASPFVGDDTEAVALLEARLREAIGLQMVADVPLGVFLSGGVDSSTVVALMQAQSSRPVKTFTVGFNEADYDEAEHAKAVARHLGTEHTELYVTPEEARAVIPRLSALYDEPFSDSSQIPTFLVSQMARQHVTVSLSGDAGDELFGGYNRYFYASAICRRLRWWPYAMRRLVASGITSLSPAMWNRLHGFALPLIPRPLHVTQPGDKAHKLAEILMAESPEEIYHELISHWKNTSDVVIGATEPLTVLTDRTNWPMTPDFVQRMMFLDAVSYLPDDILVKVDRAAMGVSLETRAPFLDHRVVEYAWQLPLSMKIRDGHGKWILRQVLYKYVPKALIERPKMGFGVPISDWLRGPLREWAEALLDESRLKREGFFRPEPIRRKWREHLSGARNWQYHLWDILMFQAWFENSKSSI